MFFYFERIMRYLFGPSIGQMFGPSIGQTWATTCDGYVKGHPAFLHTVKGTDDTWATRIAYFYVVDIYTGAIPTHELTVDMSDLFGGPPPPKTKLYYRMHRVSASTDKEAYTVIDESSLRSWFKVSN